jgi:uncharacterized protein YyaL (SSP411 family)
MKKVWIIAIGILLVSTAFVLYPTSPEKQEFADQSGDSELVWYDWNTGFEKAKKEGKMALIDCYTDWCKWCKVMDDSTFKDSAVMALMSEYFVPIKFNPEKPGRYVIGADTVSGKGLLRQLARDRFGGYPTIFIYVPQSSRMFNHPGYHRAPAFTKMLGQYVDYQKGLTSN